MSQLQEQFGSLFATRPARPVPGFVLDGPARDPADMTAVAAEPQQGVAGLRLGLVYRDSTGTESRRTVSAKRLDGEGNPPALIAFCELRASLRRFTLAGIAEAVNCRTGAAYPATDLLRPLLALGSPGNGGATGSTVAECADGLCVLAYFAEADERSEDSERAVMADYVRWRAGAVGLPGTFDPRFLARYVDALAPDADDFEAALLRLLQSDGAHAAKVVDYAARLVLSDGQAHVEEKARLKALMDLIDDHDFLTA